MRNVLSNQHMLGSHVACSQEWWGVCQCIALPASSPLLQMFLWPISGIQLPFVAAALPLVMALPLASSRRLCLRLLDEDTAAEPLVLLHSLIGAAQ